MSDESIYRAVSVARELDLSTDYFLEHEFEIYQLLREHLPISRTEARGYPGGDRAWFYAKYEDVSAAFRTPEIYSSQAGQQVIRPWIPQAIDPPEHTEYRRLMNPWFSPEAMAALEPHIREFTNELLDTMLEKDSFDFIEEFAEPFPSIIFCELMGFPLEDHEQIMNWKETLMHGGSGCKRGAELARRKAEEMGVAEVNESGKLTSSALQQVRVATGLALYQYFDRLIEEHRKEPKDDLITRLIEARYAGERPLTQEELQDTMILLFMAGLDTVTSTLGFIMHYFAEHPDKRHEWIDIMDDTSKTGPAIEELVRFHAIVTPNRRVTEDCPYRGAQLRENDQVLLSTPSANRDPDVFPNPEELVFDRHPNPHVGFALGPHRCLGMHLARRELRIALQEIHRRMPDYVITSGDKPEIFGGLKGVSYLPLTKAKGSR